MTVVPYLDFCINEEAFTLSLHPLPCQSPRRILWNLQNQEEANSRIGIWAHTPEMSQGNLNVLWANALLYGQGNWDQTGSLVHPSRAKILVLCSEAHVWETVCLSVKQSALNNAEFSIYPQLTLLFPCKNHFTPSWVYVSETFPSLSVHVFSALTIVCFACLSTQWGENSRHKPGVTVKGSFGEADQCQRGGGGGGRKEAMKAISPFLRSLQKLPMWDTEQISIYFFFALGTAPSPFTLIQY